jgi:hypothetical protein
VLSNVMISKSRFEAPARIAVVICAPIRILADIVAIFLVVLGHHEQLSIVISQLGDLGAVAVDGGPSA